MQRLIVITVPQVAGGVRYLALTREDTRAVARDWTMLDATRPVASCDVHASGEAWWNVAFDDDTPAGRRAIETARRER